MASAQHILIVNSRSVHAPVFMVGAPHSGADLIGRALKASPGFHLTLGQPSVLRTVYAFARRPSMHAGRPQAAAAVIPQGQVIPPPDPIGSANTYNADMERAQRLMPLVQEGLEGLVGRTHVPQGLRQQSSNSMPLSRRLSNQELRRRPHRDRWPA